MSACVTTRTDAASVYRQAASLEWWDSQARRHELFVCDEVIVELSDPAYPGSVAALRFLDGVALLQISQDVRGVATVFVRERVMPGPVAGDAIHVAAAAVHRVEYMLSWNVRHLANPNKIEHLGRVCARAGLLAPHILTPDLLWETDDDEADAQ